MKLQIDRIALMLWFLACCLCCEIRAQVASSNPLEYAALTEGNNLINTQIKNQTDTKLKTAGIQSTIAAEFTQIKSWEEKYNSYIKTAEGYASSLKACSHLYDDGVRILIDLNNIRKAVARNPEGLAATASMNNLYMEAATELISVYSALKNAVAKGGEDNMLTGAERSKVLWSLNDKLEAFEKKVKKLHLSLRYYTMTDVWNNYTAGMIDRDNGTVARAALGRWKRCAYAVSRN